MDKKVETKLGPCPLCREPVDPSRGDKVVLVWGKPGHFKCASRAQAKYEPYVEGSEKLVEEKAEDEETVTTTNPTNNAEAHTQRNGTPRKAKPAKAT